MLPFKKVKIPNSVKPRYEKIYRQFCWTDYDKDFIPIGVNLKYLAQMANSDNDEKATIELLKLYEKENKPAIRESKIQSEVVKYARGKGYKVYRILTENAPDRMFIGRFIVFFIEFKSTGKKPRNGQLTEHKKLKEFGFHCYVVDNIEKGKKVIDTWT